MLARRYFLVLLASACAAAGPDARPAVVGAAVPRLAGIAIETLDGKRAPLADVQGGRPTLIALWATWCDTCATEFDALAKLAPKAAARGAYIVAIAEGESRATVADFVHARALGYPQLVDEPFAIADALGARNLPTTIVLDRQGAVVFRGAALDRAALLALDRAIAQP